MSSGVDPLVRVTVALEDGTEFEALSRRSGSRIELLPADGELPPLAEGQRLGLKRPVAGDATYEEPVVVRSTDTGDGGAIVEPAGERRRHQQRDHVRVPTIQLRMQLTRLDEDREDDEAGGGDTDAEPDTRVARVVDLSAGGARVEHDGAPLPPGSRWRVQVTLPFDDGTTLRLEHEAEVRWQTEVDEGDGAAVDERGAARGADGADGWPELDGPPPTTAGLRFLTVRPGTEESVTRWVFQQQAKWLRVRRGER